MNICGRWCVRFAAPVLGLSAVAILLSPLRGGAARAAPLSMAAEVRQIERKLPAVRHLQFKTPVPVVQMTRDQVIRYIEKKLNRETPRAQIRADGMAGALLGLYPEGIDLESVTLAMMKSEVAAFYDIDGKRMVMVEGNWNTGIAPDSPSAAASTQIRENMVLAHELTHALQDQNFAVGAMLKAAKDNSDRELALRCVMEGDATLSGFDYVAGGRVTNQLLDDVMSRLSMLPQAFAAQSGGVPEGVSEPLIFQYDDGLHFVATAWRHGGWAAVDALYRRPPLSTAQIIDPALYFRHFTQPLEVKLAGYQSLLAGWKRADADTMGELTLRIILKRNLGPAAPQLALAHRWAGDRMVVLKKDSDYTVLWLVAMSDRSAAKALAAAYARILDRLPSSRLPHQAQCRGSTVLIAAGKGAGNFAALSAAIFKASTVGGRRLPLARDSDLRGSAPLYAPISSRAFAISSRSLP